MNNMLTSLQVPGLLCKHNYNEQFYRWMNRATAIFNVLLSRASTIRRNFIIDQTNAYKHARKCKLKPFAYYIKVKRIFSCDLLQVRDFECLIVNISFYQIAAVVFPTAEELKSRSEKRSIEMGREREVPAEIVNQMLGTAIGNIFSYK